MGGCHTPVQGRAPISHQGQWCNTRLQLHHQDFYNSCGPLDLSSRGYGAFERTTSDMVFQRPWYLRSPCSLIQEESPPGSQACLNRKSCLEDSGKYHSYVPFHAAYPCSQGDVKCNHLCMYSGKGWLDSFHVQSCSIPGYHKEPCCFCPGFSPE